jgi:hypothetical protein
MLEVVLALRPDLEKLEATTNTARYFSMLRAITTRLVMLSICQKIASI